MIPRARLWLTFAVGLAATIIGYAVWLGPLDTILSARGHGIVGLELAVTPSRFDQIVADWGAAAVAAAIEQVWWDFLWIPAYCLTLWTALRLAVRPGSRWGTRALLGVPIAGACDIVENVALLRGLYDTSAGVTVPVASLMASVKFALLAFVVVVLVAALIAALVDRFRWRRNHIDPARV